MIFFERPIVDGLSVCVRQYVSTIYVEFSTKAWCILGPPIEGRFCVLLEEDDVLVT